jgi:hypothetical protein
MNRVILILTASILLSSCSYIESEESASSKVEITNVCNFLINSLNEDQRILDEQNQETIDTNKRIAKDDPAYAEALMEYPSLSYGILYRDNWNQHALRMIAMYGQASRMVTEDPSFSATLKDSGFVWAKRLVVYQTAPSPLKGQLSEEQIELDTREGNINRPLIRDTCGIPQVLLP